ncbi:sugar ABC transporter ATP-binding protein [Paenarthrobacter sp. YJN-5]|uniref:sugar ABC transporter ATP-binding protein n=1 Tax=Paenarthrobacter sp. YJN-5 TaxID=2735316 RepID=UPI0018776354|nr:sugar ABC transporter ATP-binding protein [Paenarthrobacter sp. YJN-5]QOT19930.1 sugar ABC transporter ATP-binding protein [Paenarthrobacter sp. YJN-5]
MPAPLIAFRGITKSFEATRALVGVDVEIEPGSVHALVGENGAGKSTLGKILAGVHAFDAGTLELDGVAVQFDSPRAAMKAGITIVAQEIALVGPRTVVENVYLGLEDRLGPFVRARSLNARFAELVRSTGIDVPADALVDELSIADQQKVEILRALARNSDIIVMDEPTARLATHEAAKLADIVRDLRAQGKTIVYVSHFLDEVLSIADTITVLRDGTVVSTAPAATYDADLLVTQMVGRSVDAAFPDVRARTPGTSPVLSVEKIGTPGMFADITFDVHPGEIVVITGLVGSGRSEVVRAIYGAEPPSTGSARFNGKNIRYRHPKEAVADGMSFIPESRKTEGLFLGFSIADNVGLPHLQSLTQRGLLLARRVNQRVSQALVEVGAKPASPELPVGLLSGGNQQKVLFARALLGKTKLLIADEPTRGVDVAAKRQIYDLLVEHASRGLGILVVSSEMEEVIGLAHRVIVMRKGRIAGQLTDAEISGINIAQLAFGQSESRSGSNTEANQS